MKTTILYKNLKTPVVYLIHPCDYNSIHQYKTGTNWEPDKNSLY